MEHKFENINIMNFVKVLATYKGLSLRKLLSKLSLNRGYSNCYPSFYTKLKNETLRLNELKDIADELGYEIIFKDKN